MDIVLALLRTLIFVVATVAATVYIGRRIGRGRSLLWTGTTLLVLHWLIGFGWTTYQAGSPSAAGEVVGWVTWSGQLLPFLAALAYIWGIGQSAGFPARAEAGAGTRPVIAGGQVPAGPPAAAAGESLPEGSVSGRLAPAPGTGSGRGGPAVSPRPAAPGGAPGVPTPAQPPRPKQARPPGLGVPHAVPVVMTPSTGRRIPPDPDPVVDLGPEDGARPAGGLGLPESAVPGNVATTPAATGQSAPGPVSPVGSPDRDPPPTPTVARGTR